MNIESQVCSLELAKKLRELGIKQESYFIWIAHSCAGIMEKEELNPNPEYELCTHDDFDHHTDEYCSQFKITSKKYSAFTVAELGEMLPLINGCSLQILKGYSFGVDKPEYCCRYDSLDIDNTIFLDFNIANSCAKMLIYLIENKLYSTK